MSVIKAFSKDAIVYGLGNGLKKFIGFLLLPFYTRALTPADYGILETLSGVVMLLYILFSMKVVDGGSRYYYNSIDKTIKGTILFTVLCMASLSFVPVIVTLFFSESISLLLFQTREYTTVVSVSLLSIPLVILNDEQAWIYRYLKKPWRFNFFILLKSLLNISFGIYLVVHLGKGILGAQLATLISSFIVIILSIFFFNRKQYTLNFDKKWAKKILVFSSPLVLSSILTWSYTLLDRFLLLGIKDAYDVGIYSVGVTFSKPIFIINMAIGMSFYPFFMSIYENDKSKDHKYTKKSSNEIWYVYLIGTLFICLVLSLFGKEIIQWVATPEYSSSAVVIPFLVLSAIVRQSVDITSLGLFLKEKTVHYIWLTLIGTIVSVGLNLLLIPKLGFIGAACSNLISTFVYFILIYRISHMYFPVKRNLFKVGVLFLFVTVFSIGVPLLDYFEQYTISWLHKFFVICIYMTIPFSLGIAKLSQIISLFKSS
jgi:O-antigen/teichoic acid export membrane protein